MRSSHNFPPKIPREGLTLFIGALLTLSLFGGCLYDPDDRCGENQELSDSGDVCVCVEDAARVGRECVLCGENEVPAETGCECDDLYERNGAGECVSALVGFGENCTDDSDCFESGADRCMTSGDSSFCTVDCETASDCPKPAGCEVGADAPFCVPAPTGLDVECSSSDECSEFEANYCETMLENKCKVQCKDDPGACHGDWVCCDYTGLIGAAICLSPSDLDDGACPYGGELLEEN